MKPWPLARSALCATAVLAACLLGACQERGDSGTRVTLLNASYDPTRELYVDFNAAFPLLEDEERPGRAHRSVARGLGQPGAVGGRRSAGGRRDAGAGLGHRHHCGVREAATA